MEKWWATYLGTVAAYQSAGRPASTVCETGAGSGGRCEIMHDYEVGGYELVDDSGGGCCVTWEKATWPGPSPVCYGNCGRCPQPPRPFSFPLISSSSFHLIRPRTLYRLLRRHLLSPDPLCHTGIPPYRSKSGRSKRDTPNSTPFRLSTGSGQALTSTSDSSRSPTAGDASVRSVRTIRTLQRDTITYSPPTRTTLRHPSSPTRSSHGQP